MENLPLVSVIMPSYNSASFISNSIESILNQTYLNWELLITDDCSKDNTFEILNEYNKKDSRIKTFRLDKNFGAGVARNNSIKNAKGQFIAFCDSDDSWLPDKLEKQINFMISNDYDFTYTDYTIISDSKEKIGVFKSPAKMNYSKMLNNDYIGCLTVVYNASKLGKQMMPSIRKRQDWALWLELLKKTSYAYNVGEELAIYTKRDDSISANKIKLLKYIWSVYRDLERLPLHKSLYFMLFYPINYFLKIKKHLTKY